MSATLPVGASLFGFATLSTPNLGVPFGWPNDKDCSILGLAVLSRDPRLFPLEPSFNSALIVAGRMKKIWYFPKIRGPQYRPQNTTILIIGPPKWYP